MNASFETKVRGWRMKEHRARVSLGSLKLNTRFRLTQDVKVQEQVGPNSFSNVLRRPAGSTFIVVGRPELNEGGIYDLVAMDTVTQQRYLFDLMNLDGTAELM